MIFVTTGSQKFQFNRLLEKIDELIEKGVITDRVFAQTGYSDYKPKHYEFKDFMNRDEFAKHTEECTVFITHGGTGAIVGAVKKGKKVIAVPRLAKYGEHVDDHQIQILSQFNSSNLISACYELDNLEKYVKELPDKVFNSYESNTQTIIDDIEEYIHHTRRQ